MKEFVKHCPKKQYKEAYIEQSGLQYDKNNLNFKMSDHRAQIEALEKEIEYEKYLRTVLN